VILAGREREEGFFHGKQCSTDGFSLRRRFFPAMGQQKSFDELIRDLRQGTARDVAVNPSGEVVAVDLQPKAATGEIVRPDERLPTRIRETVWGGDWWKRPRNAAFFQCEREVMARQFPEFVVAASRKKPGTLAWQGVLGTNYGNQYAVEIIHKPSYPNSEPWVWVLAPKTSPLSPHLYPDGSLCLHVKSWKPFRSTAASTVVATAQWLLLHDHWRATGERW
jgi:hypothetical protein